MRSKYNSREKGFLSASTKSCRQMTPAKKRRCQQNDVFANKTTSLPKKRCRRVLYHTSHVVLSKLSQNKMSSTSSRKKSCRETKNFVARPFFLNSVGMKNPRRALKMINVWFQTPDNVLTRNSVFVFPSGPHHDYLDFLAYHISRHKRYGMT